MAQNWEPTNGPYGGAVRCFAENEEYLFAGTTGGVFAKGVFRSSDHGATWTTINNGIQSGGQGLQIDALAVSGSNVIASTLGGVYSSSDNGNTWEISNFPLEISGTPQAFLQVGDTLFAGAYGLFTSTDNGATWTESTAVFPEIPEGERPNIKSFALSGNNLYISTQGHGIYRSTDSGVTWTNVNGGLGTAYYISSSTFVNLSVNGTDVYVNKFYNKDFFRLLNNGTTWTKHQLPTITVSLYSMVVKGDYIYASTRDGVYRTNHTGTINWNQYNGNATGLGFPKLFLSGSDVFAGENIRGVYITTDDFSTWNQSADGMLGLSVRGVYKGLGTEILAQTYEGYLYHSSDLGDHWTCGNSAWGVPVYAYGDTLIAGGYRSFDNDISWEHMPFFEEGMFMRNCYFKGDTIFAGCTGPNGVYYSTDNGDSWNETSGIFSNYGTPAVFSIAAIGSNMFAGTYLDGLFKSTDNGLTWLQCNPAAMPIIEVSSVVTSGSYIFAGNSNRYDDPEYIPIGIYRSADLGNSWVQVNSGLPSLDIRSLLVDGADIYAGTREGIFKSSDNGETWTSYNQGYQPSPLATSLLIYDDYMFTSDFLAAGTVHRRLMSGSVPDMPDEIVGLSNICIGSTQIYSVTLVPDVTYTWEVPQDWSIIDGQNTNMITVLVGNSSGMVTVTPSNIWGNGPAQSLSVNAIEVVVASISIESDLNNICEGTLVNFTATAVNCGDTPVYQWYVNGISSGDNSLNFTYSPANNDEVNVQLTSSLMCVADNPVQSNTILMQVTDAVDVIVSIVEDQNNICESNIMTFTASTTNGGDQPSYSWYVNETNVGDNSATFAYAPENGDIVSLVFTSSESCVSQNPVTSNAIVAIVNALPEVSWNYTDPTTVCIEDWGPVTLTGVLPEGGVYSGDGVTGNIFDQAVAGVGNHVISYTYTDANNCSNQASIEFTVDACLGVTESANGLLVYPNPANDNFTIKLNNQNIVGVNLYNNMGIRVFSSQNVKASGITVPVQNLQSGNYILKVTSDHETFVKPLIVK
ncbi:MAG: T9SS type A sorting domain-containing protein [Bacteroidales bacterium]|nr:T9SS type A sorting domain-containing protein [Bacteroidales bacterium]